MTRSAVLCGLGGWLPPDTLTNDDLARVLDTSDQWIRSRTGIGRRHVVDAWTATSDLATEAGTRALKSAGVDSVDLVVLATATPDHRCPATAPLVALQLGLGTVPAFDLGAVCSGFVFGLAAAAGFICSGTADRVLLIGADTFSTMLDPADRSTRAVFGDGAGAVVLRAGDPSEPGALSSFDLGSDGAGSGLIAVRTGGSREPTTSVSGPGADPYFRMLGPAVFRHAVQRMAESSGIALARTGWTAGEVDLLVAHQANLRILRGVAGRLGIPPDRCAVNLDRVGNTAAASIPLALVDAVLDGTLRPGARILLTAFGGGLSWGSCTLRWPDVRPA